MPHHDLSRDALLREYASYGQPRARWRVGAEMERHLLDREGRPAPYFGAHGIQAILQRFIGLGWTPYREGPHPVALTRHGASITLEPGGQFELSGAPWSDVRGVAAEAVAFTRTLDQVLADTPWTQVALGYTPAASLRQIGWVPKGRYTVMRDHMAATGPLGLHMMKGTAATQASYDFSDETDAARKTRLAIAIAPVITAMFANSPLTEGRPNGWQSFRGHVWSGTDPARTGFPEALGRFSYERWIDYLLDVPMMFVRTHGRWTSARGLTFRRWMEGEGDVGRPPTWSDWDLHLTSVFPEVRVKKQIEVRMADCVDLPMVAAFTALFEGLFYCPTSLDGARGVAARFQSFGTREERFHIACRHGLRGVVGGRTLCWWAEQIVETAREGLLRCRPDDAPLLTPLMDRVSACRTPADDVLDAFHDGGGLPGVLRATHPFGGRG